MKYLIALVLAVIAMLALRHYMPSMSDSVSTGILNRNGISTLGDCPGTPNCQSSIDSRSNQSVAGFPISLPPSEAIARMVKIIGSIEGMEVVRHEKRYLYATATSKFMRFVDDVEFLANDDDSGLNVRSASRLGKSDFGANAKRIAMIRELSAGKL